MRDVDIIREILRGFFVDPTTPGDVPRGTGCREFLVKETKKKKEAETERGGEGRRGREREREKDCEKHSKDSSP